MISTKTKIKPRIPWSFFLNNGFEDRGEFIFNRSLFIEKETRTIKALNVDSDFFRIFALLANKNFIVEETAEIIATDLEVKGYHGPYKSLPKNLKRFVDGLNIENKEQMMFDVDEYISYDLRNFWLK